jgi:secondary thiamine-phosphate synthase enzyme
MTDQHTIEIHTTGHGHMHDITAEVQEAVTQSAVQTGIVHVFNVGSTAVIGAIEFEAGLERDMPDILDKLIPPSRHYGHEEAWHDGNGHSHLQATLMGPGITVPIHENYLVVGTWQQIIHLECDVKPRQRQVVITIIGD